MKLSGVLLSRPVKRKDRLGLALAATLGEQQKKAKQHWVATGKKQNNYSIQKLNINMKNLQLHWDRVANRKKAKQFNFLHKLTSSSWFGLILI